MTDTNFGAGLGGEAFDKATQSEKIAAIKEELNEVVTVFTAKDGKDYPVTKLHIVSSSWRRYAKEIVKVLDPQAYQQYRELKYAKGKNPDLETRREAYQFILNRFLLITYNVPGL